MTTQSKTTTQRHTPGPWSNRSSAVGIVVGPKDRAVATLGGWPNPADVSLIESAPDLLEALRVVVREVECYCADFVSTTSPCAACAARAAIAKATGAQS